MDESEVVAFETSLNNRERRYLAEYVAIQDRLTEMQRRLEVLEGCNKRGLAKMAKKKNDQRS